MAPLILLCLERSTHLYAYCLLSSLAIPTNMTFWKCFCILFIYFFVIALSARTLFEGMRYEWRYRIWQTGRQTHWRIDTQSNYPMPTVLRSPRQNEREEKKAFSICSWVILWCVCLAFHRNSCIQYKVTVMREKLKCSWVLLQGNRLTVCRIGILARALLYSGYISWG